MVLPLYDDNPFNRDYPPFVTWGLIAANVIVFLTELGAAGDSQLDTLASVWGAVPADIVHPPSGVPLWRTYGTLLTSTFMHAGWMHIFGNMLSQRIRRRHRGCAGPRPVPRVLFCERRRREPRLYRV